MFTVLGFIVLGLLVGISSSLLGLGGNIFIIPLLPLISEIPLKEVVATGIFSVLLITSINTFFFFRESLIDQKLALLLALPTFAFSFIGSKINHMVDEQLIKIALVIIMGLMLVRLNLKLGNPETKKEIGKLSLILSGSFSGILAGFTGIGSGIILGPIMLIFNLIEHKKISPTINLMIAIACLSASFSNIFYGEMSGTKLGLVHLDISLMIFVPAVLASFWGRRFNQVISKEARGKLVSVILVFLVLKMMLSS